MFIAIETKSQNMHRHGFFWNSETAEIPALATEPKILAVPIAVPAIESAVNARAFLVASITCLIGDLLLCFSKGTQDEIENLSDPDLDRALCRVLSTAEQCEQRGAVQGRQSPAAKGTTRDD